MDYKGISPYLYGSARYQRLPLPSRAYYDLSRVVSIPGYRLANPRRIGIVTCISIVLCLLSLPTIAVAQEATTTTPKDYIGLSGGLHYGYLRDKGVSPLTYSGPLLQGQLNWFSEHERWDTDLELGFGYGQHEAVRSFVVSSTVQNVQHHFSYYKRLWINQAKRLQLRTGLLYRGFTNYRITPAFRNNAAVVESINTLMAGAKLQWDIPKNMRPGKWLFLRRKGGMRHFRLQSQLNLPLLHSTWRPDYAYLSDFTNGVDNLVGSGNVFRTGGFRAYSSSSFWYYMQNGNAWTIRYSLDIQRSKNTYNLLETVQHHTQLGLLIQLN